MNSVPTPRSLAAAQRKSDWSAQLEKMGKEKGFFQHLGEDHAALFVRGGSTLVITFENLDDIRNKPEDRLPWGTAFITKRGWSSLGLMAHKPTWYRDEAVFDFFDKLKAQKFFDQFTDVVFYGTSMGAYAATTFCRAAPNARVVAISPQATLDRDTTMGWETRFRPVWHRNFKSRYGFGPDGAATAQKVMMFYDPTLLADSVHVSLYQSPNVTKFKCRNMGHGMLTTWRNIGVVSEMIEGLITDSLSTTDIYRMLRNRTRTPFYQKRLLEHLSKKNRPDWMYRYCKAVVHNAFPEGRPRFKQQMLAAKQELLRRGQKVPGGD